MGNNFHHVARTLSSNFNKTDMSIEIVTKEDLQHFRRQLLEDLLEILKPEPQIQKEWLKGNEVRQLLKISTGTLQNLRLNGTLPFTKIGGIIFYNAKGIDALLNGNLNKKQLNFKR
jgi:predicted site-specific integrase-resolvase